tara:strand:- start:599 stop:1285 length:687 start_codon:yes stop_codon:yes gene_type:complete
MQKFIKKYSAFIVVGVIAFALLGWYSPKFLLAQTVGDMMEQAKVPGKTYDSSEYNDKDIEAMVYPEGKEGCVERFKMYVMVSMQYQAGERAENFVKMKAFVPIAQRIYTKIRATSLEATTLEAMSDLDRCYKKESGVSKKAIQKNYKGCVQLNAVVLDTLASIKKRQKVDTVMTRYSKASLSLIDTPYEAINDPALMFVGALYKKAQGTSDEYDVLRRGQDIVLGCFM